MRVRTIINNMYDLLFMPVARALCPMWLLVTSFALSTAGTLAAAEELEPQPQATVSADHPEKLVKGLEVFEKHVRGLLVQKCVKCHGGEETEADFDMTTRDHLLRGGSTGKAVLVGDAQHSRLFKLITHVEEPRMPHDADKLSKDEIALIGTWIDLGAPYDRPLVGEEGKGVDWTQNKVPDNARDFWSFQPLKVIEPPAVQNTAWCRTRIDHFILAKLETATLSPNEPASKRQLIRRAYFDLIGLPPQPESVQTFIDDTSPDAFDRLIDTLLVNPHYGERWGRHWLDLARFAESHGFEHDTDRPHAYHYRDFVIKAFNMGLPFDTFVKWQISGDEYEPDNPLAMMATGFLAAGVHATQITANQAEKERYDELDDMTRTIGTSMLGLTVGCARCHDHKFDPIPQADYYRMLATFTTTVRSDFDINTNPEGYRQAKAKFDADLEPLTIALAKYEQEQLPGRFDKWLKQDVPQQAYQGWVVLEPTDAKAHDGATLTLQPDGSLLASGRNSQNDTYTLHFRTDLNPLAALRIEALAHDSLPNKGPGRADNGNFQLAKVRVSAAPAGQESSPIEIKLTNPRATFEQNNSKLSVASAIDEVPDTGWAVDPQFGKDHSAAFEFEQDVNFDSGATVTVTLEFTGNLGRNLGHLRLSLSSQRSAAPTAPSTPLAVSCLIRQFRADASRPLTDVERKELLAWYRTIDPQWQQLSAAVEAHAKQAPKPTTVKSLICSEGVPPVRLKTQGPDYYDQVYFLKRGDLNQKVSPATQSFPQVLVRSEEGERLWHANPPQGARTSYRRRALAEWITDTQYGAGHLLARVIVNRLWQHHLGRGIVATPSDFGARGERPTHPELLDWLAAELIRNGWQLKPIHKLIMSSAVYQQQSTIDPQKFAADNENRLFWRRPVQRLEAEVIRDVMLSASGLLDPTPFGPGTLDLNHKRRSIYFFVKRSRIVPMMLLFDAPDALQDIGQRQTTTVAPQALLVLNSQIVREYAAAFAQRLKLSADQSPTDAVRTGYMIAVARPPTEKELTEATTFLAEQTAAYQSAGKTDAAQLALGDLCQALLGLNEFIFVD